MRADGPVSTFSLLHSTIGVADLIKETGTLSSRLAENLFWFGRYSERCDATARLARLALARLSEGRQAQRAGSLAALLELAAGAGLIEPEVIDAPLAKAELDLFRAVLDRQAENGLAANLQRLTWCAGQAREHLSLDHWHALKRLSADIETCRKRVSDVPGLLDFLDEALTTFVSLSGFAMDNMTRDMGWRLHIVGRRIERLDNLASQLSTFLRAHTETAAALHRELAVEALLELCDSIITYRTRYRAQPGPAAGPPPADHGRGQPPRACPSRCGCSATTWRASRESGGPGRGRARKAFQALQVSPGSARTTAWPTLATPPALTLAGHFEALAAAGRQLSDLLAMRFFSHTGRTAQATFAA